MRKYSQLQKEILFFYRACIKWSHTRGEVI